jgi:hypothetical protein
MYFGMSRFGTLELSQCLDYRFGEDMLVARDITKLEQAPSVAQHVALRQPEFSTKI